MRNAFGLCLFEVLVFQKPEPDYLVIHFAASLIRSRALPSFVTEHYIHKMVNPFSSVVRLTENTIYFQPLALRHQVALVLLVSEKQ